MQTITIDIINKKALAFLKTLESMNFIRLRKSTSKKSVLKPNITKYKGTMTKQTVDEVNNQIQEMRKEWD